MIEGRLVRLRAVEPTDAANAYRWINDREVTRFLMARYPYSLASEEDWAANAARPGDYSEVRFAIETQDGTHIGLCGLHCGRPEERTADLGIMIGDRDYQDNGYGTDAMLALVRFGFEQMNLHRISLGVFEFNQRAQAVSPRPSIVRSASWMRAVSATVTFRTAATGTSSECPSWRTNGAPCTAPPQPARHPPTEPIPSLAPDPLGAKHRPVGGTPPTAHRPNQ